MNRIMTRFATIPIPKQGKDGASDGTRTRDLRRDRPAL